MGVLLFLSQFGLHQVEQMSISVQICLIVLKLDLFDLNGTGVGVRKQWSLDKGMEALIGGTAIENRLCPKHIILKGLKMLRI